MREIGYSLIWRKKIALLYSDQIRLIKARRRKLYTMPLMYNTVAKIPPPNVQNTFWKTF